MSNLNGKIVAIAGAEPELAEALARRFAKQGARLVLGSRRPELLDEVVVELRWDGAPVVSEKFDADEPDALAGLVDVALEEFGRLDALVSDAGILAGSREPAGSGPRNDMADDGVRALLDGVDAVSPAIRRLGRPGRFVYLAAPDGAGRAMAEPTIGRVAAILRRAQADVRVTLVTPEPACDPQAAPGVDAVVNAVSFALNLPEDVDVDTIVVRPQETTGEASRRPSSWPPSSARGGGSRRAFALFL